MLPGIRRRHRSAARRSEEHTSELQSRLHLVCRLLLEKKKKNDNAPTNHHNARHHACVTQTEATRETTPIKRSAPVTSSPLPVPVTTPTALAARAQHP